jgi:GGDEF domain-containing protein
MAMFTSFGRRRSGSGGDAPERELPEDVRRLLPPRFEAVGEALAAAADTRPACAVVGRDVARDGAALGEALDGLRTTFGLVMGLEPDFASVEALALGWSEATLEFLHDLSCEDPLTGLASLAHLRTRLAELYREAENEARPVSVDHALVVVETVAQGRDEHADRQFSRALRLVQVADAMRAVFPGGETVARLGADRAVVVARRAPRLGSSVALLRQVLVDCGLGADVRVWIEGLPTAAASATRLLDELSR